jgi:thiamine transport system permease protein
LGLTGLAAALPLTFLGIFFAWPAATLVARGLVSDAALDLSGFGDVFARPRTWRIIGQTLAQAAAATALALAAAVPAAHVLYRRRFPGRGAVRVLLTLPFVLPAVVVGVAFRSLLAPSGPLGGLGLDGTMWAIVSALAFFNVGLAVRLVGTFWAVLDPRPAQAARALGASPARAFLTVVLPALTPAIASAAALIFLFCATAFGTVLILGGARFGTIETEIWVQTTQMLDLRAAAVLSVAQLAVVALVLGLGGAARARRERALRLRAQPARAAAQPPLGKGDAAAAAATGIVLLAIAAPIATLVVRSLKTAGGWGLANYARLGASGGLTGLPVSLADAAQRSVRVALHATGLALALGLCIALVLTRRPRGRAGRWALGALDGAFMLPLGVSAVTVGFGFLITLDRPPLDLRDSPLLVPIAQAVVAIPLVVRSLLPVLRAIDPRQREAAAVLGAAPARVFATVELPVLARSLGLAAGLAFAVALGEFGATSFLSRPESATLPVAIFRLLGRPGAQNFGAALAACVVLATMTSLAMAFAERFRVPGTADL